jgi:hypothetical protein
MASRLSLRMSRPTRLAESGQEAGSTVHSAGDWRFAPLAAFDVSRTSSIEFIVKNSWAERAGKHKPAKIMKKKFAPR